MRPVLDAVRLQPFVLRRGAHESFEGCRADAALPAPVRGREERHGHLLPGRRARLVIGVVQRVREDLVAEIAAALLQLAVRKGRVAAHQLARDAAARAALAEAVLHGPHLHAVPVRPEGAEDAAVVRHVAVPVGRALPDAHRREVRRLQRGDVPLVDAVVRDAVQADAAARPGLHAGPLDALVEIPGLARREVIDIARRGAGAARVDAHAGIAFGHPFLGIDDLPALVPVARTVRYVGLLGHHALPRARIAFLEGETFRVGPVAEDDRVAAFARRKLIRPEHVGAQHQAVVHLYRNVPVDAHGFFIAWTARSARA